MIVRNGVDMNRSTIALALSIPLLVGAASPARRPAERPTERRISGDAIQAVRLEGHALRVRADPAAPGTLLVPRTLAERLELKAGKRLGIGFVYLIGPVRVSAGTDTAKVDFGAGPEKMRVGWTTRTFSDVADGSVGPMGLPEPLIRFVLRPADPRDRKVVLPMAPLTFPFTLFGAGWTHSYAQIVVDGAPMRLLFDPNHPQSHATAGAGVRLAKAQDGRVEGDPAMQEVAFGVERPVRRMRLRRPLAIGPLRIERLGVRTTDFGDARTIREAGATEAAPDPNEVVVTARGKKRDMRDDQITLGADVLDRCSEILFDKPKRQIELTCRDD